VSREGIRSETEPFTAERKELDAVLEAGLFAPSSNAAKLLRYVCERHFQGADDLTEFDVAIHALGRRSDFDPQRDSIVRVEAHRVRKRLLQYYEHEGASHTTRIILCRGQYLPQFQSTPEAAGPKESPPVAATSTEASTASRLRLWAMSGIAAMAATALAAGLMWHSAGNQKQPTLLPAASAKLARADTVRILAGLESGEYVDRSGTRWSADQYFDGGTALSVRYHSLALADDPAIYQHARAGENFGYNIPLKPGSYEMRLMFAESAAVAILGAVGDGARNFHVTANGVQILPPPDGQHMRELDVVADAGGADTADVKVFKDIQPSADGMLHLRFIGRNQRALVNAIEIVGGVAGKMRPLRWRAGETPYTDQKGNLWLSDRYCRGGRLSRFHAVVSLTPDPGLYEGERFGSFTYSVPVAAGSSYTLHLQFAENYFGGWVAPGSTMRLFSVYANHAELLHNFNISRDAGGPVKALTKVFRGIRPNTFDKIVLSFEPCTEFAIVNAISVEDEAK
jgi:hypothetical protein